MAASIIGYGSFSSSALGGPIPEAAISWEGDALKCALFTNSYLPDLDDSSYTAIATNEIDTGAGYTTGGVAVTGTLTYDSGTHLTKYDCTDAVWTGLTKAQIRYAVLYDSSTASKALIAYVDFGENYACTNATLTVAWAATGVGIGTST